MRIIHTADLHLDSSLSTNLDSNIQKERRRELLYNFERLINYAIDNGIHIILISGDLFDKNRISLKTKSYILGLIEENSSIDFFYIAGNHDEESFLLSIDNMPKNLKVFSDTWTSYSYDEFDITGINFNDVSEKYMYDTLSLKKDKLNIVMIHGPIDGEGKIDLSRLKNKNIDYLALGHIHNYQHESFDTRGVYVYPGCLEGRGFDEIGKKGFSLIDISNYNLTSQFVEFAKRTLYNFDIDITDLESWTEVKRQVTKTIKNVSQEDIIQIALKGFYDLDLIKQTENLEENLKDNYYFARVIDKSKLKINPKQYENDISLKGEFIRNVLSSNFSSDEKNKIIEYGIKALMKEEI